jgi:hypothetical protein
MDAPVIDETNIPYDQMDISMNKLKQVFIFTTKEISLLK